MIRFLLVVSTLGSCSASLAQNIALDPGQSLDDPRDGWLPYAFSTDSMGTAVGAAAFSSYVDLDRDPNEIKAGSNDSAEDDFVTGISNDVQFEINLKYPLAWGIAKENPTTIYHLDRG
ncbi:MAG: hypothetical protein P8Y12_11680 [Gammaproteobacteria bacterium]